MEFLVVFVPPVVLVDIAWVVLYLRDRRLVRLLRLRYPGLFDSLRGRARRWYDPPEEIWLQQRAVRRRLHGLLTPLAGSDPELTVVLQSVGAAEGWFRRAAWTGAALTLVIILALIVSFRLGGG